MQRLAVVGAEMALGTSLLALHGTSRRLRISIIGEFCA
jgi:hypothetical protein